MGGVLVDILKDLISKLTGGGEHERPHGVACRRDTRAGMRHEQVQDRQGKGRRLSCSGLGCTHDIVASHDLGDGLFLDGRGDFVAGVYNGSKNIWV